MWVSLLLGGVVFMDTEKGPICTQHCVPSLNKDTNKKWWQSVSLFVGSLICWEKKKSFYFKCWFLVGRFWQLTLGNRWYHFSDRNWQHDDGGDGEGRRRIRIVFLFILGFWCRFTELNDRVMLRFSSEWLNVWNEPANISCVLSSRFLFFIIPIILILLILECLWSYRRF